MDYFGKRDLIYIDLVSSKDAAGQMSMSADAEWFLISLGDVPYEI